MIKNIAALLCVGVLSSTAVAQGYTNNEDRWRYAPEFSIGGWLWFDQIERQ